MFADMSDGTDAADGVADTAKVDVVIAVLTALRDVVVSHGGRGIKTIGDELMCAFPDAVSGTLAAGEMQARVLALGKDDPRRTPNGLQLRLGLHYGVVLDEGDDLYGDTVNTAARVLSLCRSNQALATEDVIANLTPELVRATRFVDVMELRGKREPQRIHEIIVESSEATERGPQETTTPRIEHRSCELRHLDDSVMIGAEQPIVHIGRTSDADIRCVGGLISRENVRVEFQRQRFVVIDVSANGTYLWPEGEAAPITLRRERMTLKAGRGVIGLGRPPQRNRADDIHYVCE